MTIDIADPADPLAAHHAMAAAARLAHADIAAALAALEGLGLATGERLAAVASLSAAVAVRRHGPRIAAFFGALRDLARPALGTAAGTVAIGGLRADRLAEAVALLDGAFATLAAKLAAADFSPAAARRVELVLLARLLAHHRPQAVQLALLAAERAVARADYRPGETVVASLAPPRQGDAAAS